MVLAHTYVEQTPEQDERPNLKVVGGRDIDGSIPPVDSVTDEAEEVWRNSKSAWLKLNCTN